MSQTVKPVNQKAWFLILPVFLCPSGACSSVPNGSLRSCATRTCTPPCCGR
ncbi:MAG: hypothetical protein RLZZ584_4219 [Pseudomonadota bacterium]